MLISNTKCAENLAAGDKFLTPSGLGGGVFTVIKVETRHNVPAPERNTYDTEHDKMYIDVTRQNEEFWLWF